MRRQGDTITRALAAATASLLAALLAGCTGDPGGAATSPPPLATSTPSPMPDPTPSLTPTPVPTPSEAPELADVTVAPTEPAALDGPPTDENAAAVAAYYLSLYPYLRATGDAAAWKELAGPNCGYCSGVVDDLNRRTARKERTVGGSIEIESSGSWTGDEKEHFAWLIAVEHPSHVVNDAGDVVEEFPDRLRFRVEVALVWDGDQWLVDGVNPTRMDER